MSQNKRRHILSEKSITHSLKKEKWKRLTENKMNFKNQGTNK